MRVLLVTDSEAIKKAIYIAFAPYVVFIVKASSLKEAEELALRDDFDVIIADLDLREVYAAKDFLRLLQKNKDAKILPLQGSYSSISSEECFDLGWRHILKKPFDASKLVHFFDSQLHIPLVSIDQQSVFKKVSTATLTDDQMERTGAVNASLPANNSGSVPLLIGQQIDLEKMIEKEVKKILPSMLEEYCRSNFEQVASKVIQTEIEKLDNSRRFDTANF